MSFLAFPAFLTCFCLLLFGQPAVAVGAQDEVIQSEIGDEQIEKSAGAANPMAAINESLKNAIEQNKKIAQENQTLKEELKKLRTTQDVQANRVGLLGEQKDGLQKRVEELEKTRQDLSGQIDTLNTTIVSQQKEFEEKIVQKDEEVAGKKQAEEKAIEQILAKDKSGKKAFLNEKESADFHRLALETLSQFEDSAKQVSVKASKIEKENKKLKIDSAEMHYNLGNAFFERGQYEKAAKEYKRTLELMPSDAEAHYNLAFVTSEFLNDQRSALEHYQQYLYLNPHSDDAPLVREKILELQLQLQTRIDSPIDRDSKKKRGTKSNEKIPY